MELAKHGKFTDRRALRRSRLKTSCPLRSSSSSVSGNFPNSDGYFRRNLAGKKSKFSAARAWLRPLSTLSRGRVRLERSLISQSYLFSSSTIMDTKGLEELRKAVSDQKSSLVKDALEGDAWFQGFHPCHLIPTMPGSDWVFSSKSLRQGLASHVSIKTTGKIKAVRALLNLQWPKHLEEEKEEEVGYTPLHIACLFGSSAAINGLLKAGADPKVHTPSRWDAVELASYRSGMLDLQYDVTFNFFRSVHMDLLSKFTDSRGLLSIEGMKEYLKDRELEEWAELLDRQYGKVKEKKSEGGESEFKGVVAAMDTIIATHQEDQHKIDALPDLDEIYTLEEAFSVPEPLDEMYTREKAISKASAEEAVTATVPPSAKKPQQQQQQQRISKARRSSVLAIKKRQSILIRPPSSSSADIDFTAYKPETPSSIDRKAAKGRSAAPPSQKTNDTANATAAGARETATKQEGNTIPRPLLYAGVVSCLMAAFAASPPGFYYHVQAAPQRQLNTTAFAACLSPAGYRDTADLTAIRAINDLTNTDGVLVYLSVYAGEREPMLNKTVQQPAYERFSVAYEAKGEALARTIAETLIGEQERRYVSPGFLFRTAASICNDTADASGDVFCAALMCHNVLRALGRRSTYTDKHGVDYAPAWLRAKESYWMKSVAPALNAAMLPLRNDGGGDKWGEWYHVFGLLAYGIHEAATLSSKHVAVDIDKAIAALDTLINKFITPGHQPEDPVKAQVDRDTAEVLRHLLLQDYPSDYVSHAGCMDDDGWYVVAAPAG
eukprot:jgi/Bigna1/84092/fgenesh1_pg.122_\